MIVFILDKMIRAQVRTAQALVNSFVNFLGFMGFLYLIANVFSGRKSK